MNFHLKFLPLENQIPKNSEDLHTVENILTGEDIEKHRNLVRHEVNAFSIETETLNDVDP